MKFDFDSFGTQVIYYEENLGVPEGPVMDAMLPQRDTVRQEA